MSQIPSIPGIALRLISSGQLPERLQGGRFVGELPQLNIGDEIPVTVIRSTPANSVLDVQGSRFTAGALPGVEAGAQLTVRVVGLTPQLRLQIIAAAAGELPDASNAASTRSAVAWESVALPETASYSPFPNRDARTPRSPSDSASAAALAETLSAEGEVPASPANIVELPSLGVGQELNVQVVAKTPDGKVLLNLLGTEVEADAPKSLRVGQELPVRVAQVGQQVILEIQQPEPPVQSEALSLLRAHLDDQTPLARVLTAVRQALAEPDTQAALPSGGKLQALLETLHPAQAPPNSEQIAAQVRDGGLHYEAKLAEIPLDNPQAARNVVDGDVKGLLLQTLREAQTGDAPAAQRALGPIAGQLNHLESQQALNLLGQMQGGPYSLQIPFAAGQGLQTARLSIQPDRQNSRDGIGGPPGQNIYFILDMERLGKTRVDGHFTERTARVVFYADSPDWLGRLRAGLPAFREALLAVGYREVLLAGRPLQQMPADKKPAFDALAAGVPAGVSLVDRRV